MRRMNTDMLEANNTGKGRGYSIKPENLNLDEYKNLLLNKLTDSLGFNMDDLRLQLSHTTTISVNKFGDRSYD